MGHGLKIIARPTIVIILSFHFCTRVVILWSVTKYMILKDRLSHSVWADAFRR